MNSTTIRIYPVSKKEMEKLMEQRIIKEKRLRPYTHGEFVDLLILTYKEHKSKCR